MPGQPPTPDEDPRLPDDPTSRRDTSAYEATPDDRRRAWVIALFIGVTLALAIVLAYFYAMPSAD